MNTATDRFEHGRHIAQFTLWGNLAVQLVITWTIDTPDPSLLLRALSGTLFLATAATFAAMHRHGREACSRCLARTPLDPQDAVRRWRPALHLLHRKPLCWCAPMVALVSVTLFAPQGGVLAHAMGTAFLVATALFWLALDRHGVLQPWCHPRDDGDGALAPEPEPSLGRSR